MDDEDEFVANHTEILDIAQMKAIVQGLTAQNAVETANVEYRHAPRKAPAPV